jgi:amino acid adenylation domain-containing protein
MTAQLESAMPNVGLDGAAITHSQKQIWIGQKLHPECPLYNMAFAFLFEAELRADVFAQAWQRVVNGSDALRTRFLEHETGLQRLLAPVGAATEILDFSSRPDPEREFRHWCRQRSRRALPLAGDLVDSVLIRLGGDRTGWYLNQHHLITDAWSTQLLYHEVGEEYAALLRGVGGDRVPLHPYYSTATSLGSGGGERGRSLEHWDSRRRRSGRLVSLYGRGGEPVGTASRRLTLEIDRGRSRALDELSGQDGFVSLSGELSRFALFATLLVSWLHRISAESDLGFDAPVAGRPSAEAKRALGLFIEMFPFTVTVESQDTFRSLGARCVAEAKSFLSHALPGMSSPSGTSASNVVLNYFPAAFGEFAGLPVEAEWIHPGHGDSVHSLRLQVHDFSGSGRYLLHFDGNEGALPERFWQRGLEHFEKLLDACLTDPDCLIASVDVLVDEERQALAELNATGSSPLPDRSVVAMFKEQADLTPERPALRQGQSELSFADLRADSDALAASLLEHGVEPGDRVAIVGRRSIPAVTAILGILRAGAAYVPIEPSAPQARIDHIVRDCGARLLVVGDGAEAVSMPREFAVLSIAEAIRAGSGVRPERPGPDLGDLAYLIYTSGSTGQPKGVLIEHHGLADYLCWASRTYVRGDRLTFALCTSLAFDLTVTSLFLPLITGGTLEVYPESVGPLDASLMDVVKANSVDFIKLTPSHLSLLVRTGLEGSRIRRMVIGGENLTTHLAAAASAQLRDQVELYNEYGPTEAVVGCLVHRYSPGVDTAPSVPIGKPVDHVEVEVLNEARVPVPEGVPGELWISRYGLSRGYHGLDGLTAESFELHPHRSGEARYRTGDRVRMVDGGGFEYLGRLDRQLKVSGFRLEPGEVEAAMLSLPAIEECAVIGRQRSAETLESSEEVHHCIRCGLPSNYPRAVFDEEGLCSVCRSYELVKDYAQDYFKAEDDLRQLFAESARSNSSEYDCLMLFSGGKDSSYALCRLVEMGVSVYAFTLDNGFISDSAKENIRKVSEQLGVPVEFATTPAMNDIFRDSLMRFSNVCQGCFKTIYTLSMKRAHELRIPIIVTGLSRGQMFETRLTEEMFRDGRCSPEEVDAAVLAARKVYHRVSDEVSRSLDVAFLLDGQIFEEIEIVDFYRYVDVGLDEVYSYLERTVPWLRPQDTGRSTNCLINDVGIHVHKKERGYHNYALPYSWDVRLGHKDREVALDELDDDIDLEYVQRTLTEIGYDDEPATTGTDQMVLYGFYVASGEVSDAELRRQLGARLPGPLIPGHLQRVESIPLTANGKIDEEVLYRKARGKLPETRYLRPEGPVAEFLAELWQHELGIQRVGADDSFFELGGTSLGAMQVMIQLCQEYAIELPLETMFSHPTLGALARVAEDRILDDVSSLSQVERERLIDEGTTPS